MPSILDSDPADWVNELNARPEHSSNDSARLHSEPAKPTIGRIVHYCFVDRYGQPVERPAIIVRVWFDDTVQLQVFTDGSNDGPDYASEIVWRTSVHYSPEPENHTWHWSYDANN